MLAAVAFVVVGKAIPALLPAAAGVRQAIAPTYTLIATVLAVLLCLIGIAAWVRQRQGKPTPTAAAGRPREPTFGPSAGAVAERAAAGDARLDQLRPDRHTADAAHAAEARPQQWSIDVLRRMEWKQLERLVAAFYAQTGFRTEMIQAGADGGVDVRLYRGDAPAPIAIVQCKAWQSRLVGVKPVRELLGVMAHERVKAGIFIATSGYTDEALALAPNNNLVLVSGAQLLEKIRALPDPAQAELLRVATDGDWTTPTCPSCGTKMMLREAKADAKRFWGCVSFPRCRQTFPLQAAP